MTVFIDLILFIWPVKMNGFLLIVDVPDICVWLVIYPAFFTIQFWFQIQTKCWVAPDIATRYSTYLRNSIGAWMSKSG